MVTEVLKLWKCPNTIRSYIIFGAGLILGTRFGKRTCFASWRARVSRRPKSASQSDYSGVFLAPTPTQNRRRLWELGLLFPTRLCSRSQRKLVHSDCCINVYDRSLIAQPRNGASSPLLSSSARLKVPVAGIGCEGFFYTTMIVVTTEAFTSHWMSKRTDPQPRPSSPCPRQTVGGSYYS